MIAVLLLGLAYGGREIYMRFTHVYEYDARVSADIVTISSRGDGWVVDMSVREGMHVEAGQVLAQLRGLGIAVAFGRGQNPDAVDKRLEVSGRRQGFVEHLRASSGQSLPASCRSTNVAASPTLLWHTKPNTQGTA